ncbi:MAG: ABC transporter permease [Vicinamibacterales bacterium]
MDMLRQDLRLAVRSLAGEPGVAMVAVASLAIGIAANATVFSLVQALEFPHLPYPDASRIVFIESRNLQRDLSELPISAPDALDLASSVHTLERPALSVDESITIREAATPAHWSGRLVAPAFFDVMGVGASQGRALAAGDDGVIVLADRFWRAELGGDSSIVGRAIHVDDGLRTVVGVMPPRFDPDADFWMPLPSSVTSSAARDDRRFTTFARLAAGRSPDDAVREIAAISARLTAEHPATNTGWEMFPTSLARMHGQDSRGVFLLMQGAVAFVLLIACANIANLLLARGTRRAQEMAIRIALGADRARLVRQLLTESLLLALGGGLAGVVLTMWGIRLTRLLFDFPESIAPELNGIVLAFTGGVAVLTGVASGIVPALRASSVAPRATLQADGARGVTDTARGGLRAGLVAVQIACAVVLATGAGLLVQSLINRQRVDLGFNPAGAVRADLSLSGSRYDAPEAQRAAASAVIDRIVASPEVAAAGATAYAMPQGVGARPQLTLPGRGDAAPGVGAPNAIEAATPGYFAAMGIPIIEGRGLADTDRAGGPVVAVINQEFAQNVWPDRHPIGDRVRLGPPGSAAPVVTIVGVAGSIRRSAMHGSVAPRIYVALVQFPARNLSLVVRGRAVAGPATSVMRAAVREADPALVLDNVRTIEADVAQFIEPVRSLTRLFTAFGVTGLLLAALGVFGTVSYAVSQRRREMAVRSALGATRGDLVRLVLGHGLRLAAMGLAVGLAVAVVAARALSGLLFGVAPADPLTFIGVALTLVIVALAACYRPARAAAAVDPMTVLRRE